ncbi:MAG: NAD(P)-dependent dehydrogenase (short-subunit alcohol dehydrogenase family) [Candidatus Azotimanducaceae bacterium]|mgnify:FL=1|jgi:NAD(P)-dependent dehydrogenase (short-subunit alcohol dehydrogenase family)|tara:strand:+ start:756 stop:1520 length:765 start_codon:yes stop_codon:yes gene_type:complete
MGRLDGKVAIITGGAGGIGIAAGKRFVAEGASVLLVDLDEQALSQACSKIASNKVSYHVGDVTRAADNNAMAEVATERFGGVDIFLANAGIEGDVASILDYDEARFDQVMDVNVKGPFLGLRAVVPEMQKRGGGSVIITSSIMGVKGGASVAPYATSKHAVIGLMKSASREFAAQNIRVNTVNPAPVNTRMMRSLEEGMRPGEADEAKAGIEAGIPMQRYAEPEDIANIMLFLASDESAFITGSVYLADGGITS